MDWRKGKGRHIHGNVGIQVLGGGCRLRRADRRENVRMPAQGLWAGRQQTTTRK